MLEKLALGIVVALSVVIIYGRFYNNNFYRKLFDLEDVFERERDFIPLSKLVLAKLIQHGAFNGGVLYWFDETQAEFKLKTLHGVAANIISHLTKVLRHPQGILYHLRKNKDGFIITDFVKDKRLKDLNLTPLAHLGPNMMVIPFQTNDKTLGICILFGNNNSRRKEHLKLFKIFGTRAAVQLDNARLYQLMKETATENARLYLNISRLYQQATCDELTGSYNRNFMMQRFKEEVKKAWRFGQPLSIILTDIDFFKKINDQYGHQAGDEILSEFSRALKASVREYDIICRFGGEEFVIILPHTNHVNATELAERLRSKLESYPFLIEDIPIGITASFGISALPMIQEAALPNPEKVEEMIQSLIANADEALYRAKRNGRNQVQFMGYHLCKKTKKSVLTALN